MSSPKSKESKTDGQDRETASAEPTENRSDERPAGQQPAQTALNVDDSRAVAHYANFCRVSSTPEELILDLGLNPNAFNANSTTVKVSQRIILNHFTAKRLLSALSMALQRHEQAFGVLETDARKRLQQT